MPWGRRATMTEWVRVCAVEELPLNQARVVEIDGTNVAVFRCSENVFYAVEDRCPHRGAPLSRGVIYEDNKIACLDHGWGICLPTGQVEAPQCGRVRTFAVKLQDNLIWVKR
jgi:nitrite reductase (NADH) small subunit